jgi:hypothetical protein
MKKVFYISLVIVAASFVFSSCTKEEVKPQGGAQPTGYGIKE